MKSYTLKELNDLNALTQQLAPKLIPGDLVLLNGDLGAGKTEFARSLIRHMLNQPNETVPSPTFTLVQDYIISQDNGVSGHVVHHYDLYRLEDPEEAYEIGFYDNLHDGISLVEWPNRLGHISYSNVLQITILLQEDQTRRLSMLGKGRLQNIEQTISL